MYKVRWNSCVSTLRDIGLTLNYEKSHLQPTGNLEIFGLDIDLPRPQISLPRSVYSICWDFWRFYRRLPPRAYGESPDVTWIVWAMNWPIFAASHLLQRDSYWIRWLHRNGLLQYPRRLAPPLASVMVCADATPTIIGVY
jgi:hypothetical protein